MRTERATSQVPMKLQQYARVNRDVLDALPHPDEGVWVATDSFPEEFYGELRRLRELGLINAVGRRKVDAYPKDGSYRVAWQTDPVAYHALDEQGMFDINRAPTYGGEGMGCPACGRVSFVNLDGERLRCKQCDHVGQKDAWVVGGDPA